VANAMGIVILTMNVWELWNVIVVLATTAHLFQAVKDKEHLVMTIAMNHPDGC
jgi:hypothetical protein